MNSYTHKGEPDQVVRDSSGQPAVFAARGLSKSYGPVVGCRDVDLDVRGGELLAIVGDNGAGKSTVIKILTGAIQPDSGRILRAGEEVRFGSPLEAMRHGAGVCYQDLALAPNLDAVGNIFVGREIKKKLFGVPFVKVLDEAAMEQTAEHVVEKLKIGIPRLRGMEVGLMSGGQRQAVAIARAMTFASEALFMDEPTAALGVKESGAVLNLIQKVLSEGIAVVMVSHIIPHVLELADRVVVMRHGEVVAELSRQEVNMDRLVRLIVGG